VWIRNPIWPPQDYVKLVLKVAIIQDEKMLEISVRKNK
jgi:hypothetical protein